MQRRTALKLLAATAVAPQLSPIMRAAAPRTASLAASDDAFLDDLERRSCLYFLEQFGQESGQVLDRAAASNVTGERDPRVMASIAATGFGLTALCVADHRAYAQRDRLIEQTRRTLRFHLEHLEHDHGFFYHFNDVDNGTPFGGSEISSIDTALLLCGVLTARAHFHTDAEIVSLATKLYERVDWPYMLNNGPTFSMGIREGHFLDARWEHFCELMMIYLLALGSPTHPVAAATWDAWSRPTITYDGITYISSSDPIFTHQYSHAWFDFRHKRDKYANYFENSVLATRAHRAFCIDLGGPYSAEYWGISASDSAHGYTAWGGPSATPMSAAAMAETRKHLAGTKPARLHDAAFARSFGGVDGSVVPNAAAGSLPFLPEECLRTLQAQKQRYGARAWGRYSFCDAYHPAAGWYDADVLGIDLGISLLMAENLRSGFVWETFARNPEVSVAFQRAGFRAE
jgi:hypothetical protein